MMNLQTKVLLVVGLLVLVAVSAYAAGLFKDRQPEAFKPITDDPQVVRYLPLGDSYTIGESVSEAERWPNQLAAAYMPGGKRLQILANPSVTGYTTQDLIDKELPLVERLKPEFVTVLIGVNDYVQGVSPQTFQKNLEYIIQQLQAQLVQPGNILLVTIPDYAKTPSGARFGEPVAATAAIERFNKIITDTAAKANLPVADIFATSQLVASDPQLTAADGLHPSGKQYQAWTNVIKQRLEASSIPK